MHTQGREAVILPLILGLLLMLLIPGSLNRPATIKTTPVRQDWATMVAMPSGPEEYIWENQSIEPVLADKGERYIQEIRRSLEKQQPLIEKQVREMQPLIRTLEKNVEKLAERYKEMNLYPVGYTEPQSETREVIIKEEATGNNASAVKVYSMIMKDGKWIIVPQWMATAKKTGDDSTGDLKKDSIKANPVFQQ